MLSFLVAKSFSEEVNLCIKDESSTAVCPDNYQLITTANFDSWTEKVSQFGNNNVNMYFGSSLPTGKMISPNALRYYVDKLTINGSNSDIRVNIDTKQNFVMIEALEANTVSLVLSTTVLSCDKVTLNKVRIASEQEGALTCDSLELNGDISSIVVFTKLITATKSNLALNHFDLKNSIELNFDNIYAFDLSITGIDSDMEWAGLPNVLRMKYGDNSNTISLNIRSMNPTIAVDHSVKDVKLSLSEIAVAGVSLIRSIKFVADGSYIDFPFSMDDLLNTITIEPKNNAVIRQGGQSLNAKVDGTSYKYVLSSEAKSAGSLRLGAEVSIDKEGNQSQVVTFTEFAAQDADKHSVSSGKLVNSYVPTFVVNKETEFKGEGKYSFGQLVVESPLTISELVLNKETELIINTASLPVITATKVSAKDAIVNVNINDDIKAGHYDLIKTTGLECGQINFVINGIKGTKYEFQHLDAKLTCSASGVALDVTERAAEKNDKFCLGEGECPEYYTQISTQEKFDSWKTLVPADHKNIHFMVLKDFGDTSVPLVFDFAGLGNGLNVEFEQVGGLKTRALEITAKSFDGMINKLVTNIDLGINGEITKKLKLPNLYLKKTLLDEKFQNNLDTECQERYVIEMTTESRLDFFAAAETEVYLPSSDATIMFDEGEWTIKMNDISISEYSIKSLDKIVTIHPVKNSKAKFTIQCKPTSTIVHPIYIDASVDTSVFVIEGTWPQNETSVYFVNPGNSQFLLNSKTVPAAFKFTEESRAVSIASDKPSLNFTTPMHVYSSVNFGASVIIDELKLSNNGNIQSEANEKIQINKLLLDQGVDTRIPAQAEIKEMRLNKLSNVNFGVTDENNFPGKIDFEYSLTSMPFISADAITRKNISLGFYYNQGTEAELTKEQMIELEKIPIKVICGRNLTCANWTAEFIGNETFTPSCTQHGDYQCYELKFIPNYYIDYSLNAIEITIITCFSILVIACIGGCVYCGISAKKSTVGSSKKEAQLLLETQSVQ